MPGRPVETGCHHPLTAVVEQIEDVFIGMGYEVAEGTEVEKLLQLRSTKLTERSPSA